MFLQTSCPSVFGSPWPVCEEIQFLLMAVVGLVNDVKGVKIIKLMMVGFHLLGVFHTVHADLLYCHGLVPHLHWMKPSLKLLVTLFSFFQLWWVKISARERSIVAAVMVSPGWMIERIQFLQCPISTLLCSADTQAVIAYRKCSPSLCHHQVKVYLLPLTFTWGCYFPFSNIGVWLSLSPDLIPIVTLLRYLHAHNSHPPWCVELPQAQDRTISWSHLGGLKTLRVFSHLHHLVWLNQTLTCFPTQNDLFRKVWKQ